MCLVGPNESCVKDDYQLMAFTAEGDVPLNHLNLAVKRVPKAVAKNLILCITAYCDDHQSNIPKGYKKIE